LTPAWSPDALEFARLHGLTAAVESAIAVAKGSFPAIVGMAVETETDHEDEDQVLALELVVGAKRTEALAAYHEYASRWVKVATWPQRDRVRLSYFTTDDSPT
jgi:hypothetical protein